MIAICRALAIADIMVDYLTGYLRPCNRKGVEVLKFLLDKISSLGSDISKILGELLLLYFDIIIFILGLRKVGALNYLIVKK